MGQEISISGTFSQAMQIGNECGFFRDHDLACAMFARGNKQLIVSFCNLASFQDEQRMPWLYGKSQQYGWSILGIMAKKKDWYRNNSAPEIILKLVAEGFFLEFDRIVFTGTSMGGFAALTLSSLVPGSQVLAFSPQSTLDAPLVPFDKRYKWARKNTDWIYPELKDAAQLTQVSEKIFIVLDPMIPEDRQHVDRISPDNLVRLNCRFMGHTLPNSLKRAGVLDHLICSVMDDNFSQKGFYMEFRSGRRNMITWRKSLINSAIERDHPRLALAVCERTLQDGGGPFFRKTKTRLMEEYAKGRSS